MFNDDISCILLLGLSQVKLPTSFSYRCLRLVLKFQVTSGLSEEKLQEFREIFSFFDRWVFGRCFPLTYEYEEECSSAGIYKQYMGARNRVGIGVVVPAGTGSLESILGLLKSLKIRAQDFASRYTYWSRHVKSWDYINGKYFRVSQNSLSTIVATEI